MSVNFIYEARFSIAEEMNREFLGGVHGLVDHLLGSAADDLELVGHRLTIDKALGTLSIAFGIAAGSFDAARELARPLVAGAVRQRAEPLDRWTFTLHSEEVVDLAVDRSSPAWRRSLGPCDGFTTDDRPNDGLVWELVNGVLCSKPLKTETEARVVSNLVRLLSGENDKPNDHTR